MCTHFYIVYLLLMILTHQITITFSQACHSSSVCTHTCACACRLPITQTRPTDEHCEWSFTNGKMQLKIFFLLFDKAALFSVFPLNIRNMYHFTLFVSCPRIVIVSFFFCHRSNWQWVLETTGKDRGWTGWNPVSPALCLPD